jgi:hypothetical protein
MEHASLVWSPSDVNDTDLIERVQKSFLRYLYMREYKYYPFLFPTKFLQGMLGYESLELPRRIYLGKHLVKLLVGVLHNPEILEEFRFRAPDNYQRLRSQVLFEVPYARTNVLGRSPISIAIRMFNKLSDGNDLFCDGCPQIVKAIRACNAE